MEATCVFYVSTLIILTAYKDSKSRINYILSHYNYVQYYDIIYTVYMKIAALTMPFNDYTYRKRY